MTYFLSLVQVVGLVAAVVGLYLLAGLAVTLLVAGLVVVFLGAVYEVVVMKSRTEDGDH